MNDDKNVTDKGAVEIREDDLDQAVGGSADFHIKRDAIDGKLVNPALPGANKIAPGTIRVQKV